MSEIKHVLIFLTAWSMMFLKSLTVINTLFRSSKVHYRFRCISLLDSTQSSYVHPVSQNAILLFFHWDVSPRIRTGRRNLLGSKFQVAIYVKNRIARVYTVWQLSTQIDAITIILLTPSTGMNGTSYREYSRTWRVSLNLSGWCIWDLQLFWRS
jgi:hypothetical protein